MGGSKALILSAHVTQWPLFILGKIVWNFFLQNFNGVFCLKISFLFYRFTKSFPEFFLKNRNSPHINTGFGFDAVFHRFSPFWFPFWATSFYCKNFNLKNMILSCTRIFAWRKWPKFPRFWRKKISSLQI